MKLKIVNKSTQNMGELEQILTKFFPYAQKRLGFDKPVQLNLVSDPENAKDPFGKTAYYNPGSMHITLFIDKRHPKDILRSFSHELVHHSQNCNGEFQNGEEMEKGYAQENKHLRKLEAMAYLLGNGLIVRDYCDTQLKENKIMSSKNIENVKELIQKAIDILQEGGAAARSGNEDRDVGRERMTSDRIREEDEKALEEDEETLEEEEVNEDDETLKEYDYDDAGYLAHDAADQQCRHLRDIEKYNACIKAEMARGVTHATAPVREEVAEELNETFTSKKEQMLFKDLIKKWCK